MQMSTMAAAVNGSNCQGVKNASSVPRTAAEKSRQADADPVSKQTHDRGLQEDHPHNPQIGHSHRL